MKSGRWVWVEFPDPCKGDELPDSYFSINPGVAVYCRLFARGVRDELLDWIAANPDARPPMKLRKPKLEAWIEARMCEQKSVAVEQGRGLFDNFDSLNKPLALDSPSQRN